ncbi:MAG: hypothetical protein AB7U78_25805 [Hyphomicrobiaceae bacterium]
MKQGSEVAPFLSARVDWLSAIKAYFAVALMANLSWEILQLPLYTIWTKGTMREITFAVIHCTLGDVLIALAALTLALIVVGTREWPNSEYSAVLMGTVLIGVGYTIFSEWLNIVIRASWAYSPLMPVVPIINTGLSPLLQWIVIPIAALTAAKRAAF